jgi:hypothetical protein
MSFPYDPGPGDARGAGSLRAVTPANSDLPNGIARALWVGGAGDVAIVAESDGTTAVTIASVAAGTLLPVRAKRVNSTNTTATAIVALY